MLAVQVSGREIGLVGYEVLKSYMRNLLTVVDAMLLLPA